MTTKGVTALVIPAVALILLSTSACSVDKPFYYHTVEGEVPMTGAVERASALSAGDAAYGAGNTNGSDNSLYLDFSFSGGSLTASADAVKGPGDYGLLSLHVSIETIDAPLVAFECSLSCQPCTLKLTGVSNDQISGAFACTGLRHCLDATPVSRPAEDPACNGAESYVAGISAEFIMSEGSNRRKDY